MTAQSFFHQAIALHQSGRLAEAEPVYLQLLAAEPAHAQAHYLLAMLRYQQGRIAEAVPSAQMALQLHPEFAEALLLRGALMLALGRHETALSDFTRATDLKPDHAEAWYNRGVAFSAMGRPDDAVAAFDRALALQPAAHIWNSRGAALQNLLQPEAALQSFDQALALNPQMFETWHNRGIALQALHRHEAALESHDRAVAIQPGFAAAWHGRGKALHALKRFDDAIASHDRALALTPDDAELLHWRGRGHQMAQHFGAALADLDRSLALRPDDLLTLAAQAATLCEAHRVPEGIGVYARYAELAYGGKPVEAPNDPPHKQRHDAEQRDWLAAQQITTAMIHAAGARLAGPAVNPAQTVAVETEWQGSKPQIVVIDNFLTPEALDGLRRFCWGAPIWRKAYKNGYLGAMPEHGFACPLLAQIAEELSATYPAIFGEHGLTMLWGFKYDGSLGGIRIHADQAAVNVNFWITPDDANRDPGHGGLVIWDASAPLDWDITKYNGDDAAVRAFLAEARSQATTVPYRANRAVIFDSDLFHETDTLDFAPGYENRRLNVTLLYGRRTFDAR